MQCSSSSARGLSLAILAPLALASLSVVPLACAAGNVRSTGFAVDGGAPGDDGSVVDPADAATADDAEGSVTPVAKPLPAVPFHTSGRWILDAKDQRFKLASMNWYGAESKDSP